MINNEKKEDLDQKANFISQYLDMTQGNKEFEFFQLEQIINDLMDGIFRKLVEKCTKEDRTYIINKIRESKSFYFGTLEGVCEDNNRYWFSVDKSRNNAFFERYKRYLINEKKFNLKAVDDLSNNVLNPILNQLGNPKADKFNIHGLVMGDVQSGKTMTYIGMINKAVDAGYKLIIILTGTIESLRKQTQERIDLGFTGFDSDSENPKDATMKKNTRFIGVGKDKITKPGTRFASSFTTKVEDFNSTLANGICTSLDLLKGPAVMVIKKNVKVLERIYDWLVKQHGVTDGKKLNFPLLMIDDEADNASINTKDADSDPTRTNAGIRRILNLFNKYSYVGFTATPFANIFIDPTTYSDEYGHDLFPSDFIFSLIPNAEYIGGKDIFLDDSKYKSALINNDDCMEVLPSTHKKDHNFDKLPKTLEDAIILFTLSNVIRDLRGDNKKHHSMLINISRFTIMHDVIKDIVENFYKQLLDIYFTFAKIDNDNEIMERVKNLFDKEYSNCKSDWNQVKKCLYDSNKLVTILSVNKDSEMINYKDYEETGSRNIFIGGLSLSRGLTLEGLCISYFYRYSKTYDVLFQMGRWFGYRSNYEDLFRIYMPSELAGWYSIITESMEELKYDLRRMREADRKPIDYGIRVSNDSTKLKLTTASKMKTAETAYKTVLGFGEVIATGDIINDVKKNESNLDLIVSNLENYKKQSNKLFEKDTITNNTIIKDVPFDIVRNIISNFDVSPANDLYEKNSLLKFIEQYSDKYFKKWDIAFIEGQKDISTNLYEIKPLQISIHKALKKFDIQHNYIRIQKAREQLNNPLDTATGLPQNVYKTIVDDYKKNYIKKHPEALKSKISISGKRYLEFAERNPLLMIYIIDLSNSDEINSLEETRLKYENSNVPPVGLALGIPQYEYICTEKNLYKINVVEQRRLREREYNYSIDEDVEEE